MTTKASKGWIQGKFDLHQCQPIQMDLFLYQRKKTFILQLIIHYKHILNL